MANGFLVLTECAGDKYDDAIEYLMDHPEEIFEVWVGDPDNLPEAVEAHCLFQFCTPTGKIERRNNGEKCGCLTQVKEDAGYVAWTDDLTNRILADVLIPNGPELIRNLPDHERLAVLNRFADYQREMDATIRNPEWKGEEVANG